jgi:hypothetical protein
MILYIILIILIIILLLLCFKNNKEYFDIPTYKNIMLNNNKKKLYKIGLDKDINIDDEDCYKKCDYENCTKLHDMRKELKKCVKCNSQKNKCFKKSIIGGLCNDCESEMDDKINCYNTTNFGCANPNNIQYNIGVDPYFVEINDDNVNSPYNKKCVFCWNLLDNI